MLSIPEMRTAAPVSVVASLAPAGEACRPCRTCLYRRRRPRRHTAQAGHAADIGGRVLAPPSHYLRFVGCRFLQSMHQPAGLPGLEQCALRQIQIWVLFLGGHYAGRDCTYTRSRGIVEHWFMARKNAARRAYHRAALSISGAPVMRHPLRTMSSARFRRAGFRRVPVQNFRDRIHWTPYPKLTQYAALCGKVRGRQSTPVPGVVMEARQPCACCQRRRQSRIPDPVPVVLSEKCVSWSMRLSR